MVVDFVTGGGHQNEISRNKYNTKQFTKYIEIK